MMLRMTPAEYEALRARGLDKHTDPPKKAKKAATGLKSRPRGHSEGEVAFAAQLRKGRITGWEQEYEFAKDVGRKWRFDFAFRQRKLAVEIEGGVWSGGRHNRGSGFIADAEKYNYAAFKGWSVLRFTTQQAKNGEAYRQTLEFLNC